MKDHLYVHLIVFVNVQKCLRILFEFLALHASIVISFTKLDLTIVSSFMQGWVDEVEGKMCVEGLWTWR